MKLKSVLFLLVFLGLAQLSSAQNVSGFGQQKLQNVNVDTLSQQRVLQIYKEAKSRGLSINQVVQLAVQRGMPSVQARKLRAKLQRIQTVNQNALGNGMNAINRMRYPPVSDTTRAAYFNYFYGVRSRRDSIRFYQEIGHLKYQAELDSVSLARKKLRSKIFGLRLFSNSSKTFQPALNIPTPSNYQLGPGDHVIIDIYGAAQQTYDLQVSPDGMVDINRIGPVSVDGLTISQAKKRLKSRLEQIYTDLNPKNESPQKTYMQLTLGQVRSIKVTVIGEAVHPGTYTLSSLSTVFNALYSAGGPTVNGSLRDIDIIRGDSVFKTFDLYDLLINGDRSQNIQLRSQDIIKINPYISRVHITGEVKRPGIYEMKPTGTLGDLMTFAGGFRGDAYTRQLQVLGTKNGRRTINDVKKDNFNQFILKNGDSVAVGKSLNRFSNLVKIQGAVFRPGKYELTDTSSVYSLIKEAGGLRGDAFDNRGIIYRQKNNYTLKTLSFNVLKLMNDPRKYNIPLKKNDLVVVSSILNMRGKEAVQIEGPVQKPGAYKYADGMTLQDLILRANGLTPKASPDRIDVARRITGAKSRQESSQIAHIYHFSINPDLSLNPGGKSFILQPYDIVYVRSAPSYHKQKQVMISGQVRYPGRYTLESKKSRIADLIKRAGGLTNEAYPPGASLYRKLTSSQLQGRVYQAGVQGILTTTQNADTNRQGKSLQNMQQPRHYKISKVGIQLPKILEHPNSKYDLLLKQGDSLYIPQKLETVFVKGGVYNPTNIRYDKRLNFQDYISEAGGYNLKAKKNQAYVIYANGKVNSIKRFLFFKSYPNVKPGATLVVPVKKQVRGISPQQRITILSAIISTLALITTTIVQVTR
jgi:protein involved in polysaccharide export with SLBB domain